MSDQKTVSVKFFLNKRLKGEEFEGVTFFPLYARINFLGNNTSVRVNKRSGNLIMMNELEFEALDDILNSGKYPENILYSTNAWHILNRRELIIRSVQWEYEKQGERFEFKVFTQKYKRWEQDLFLLLYDRFVFDCKAILWNKTTSLDAYRSINFEYIPRSTEDLLEWKRMTSGYHIDSDFFRLGESLLALEYFNQYLFEVKLSSPDSFAHTPTERSTVFSWENGTDRMDFVKYVEKAFDHIQNNHAIKKPPLNVKYYSPFSDLFLQEFSFNPEFLDIYKEVIEEEVVSYSVPYNKK